MYKPITIKDIAKALNISASTVSRALRDSHEINEATKTSVQEYAKANGYQKNPNALGLKKNRSFSIGVIVPALANSFFSQAINGMESVATQKGYHLFISQSHDSFDTEKQLIQHMANRTIDGILISLASETHQFQHIIEPFERGLPIVFFDRVSQSIDTHKIILNNVKETYKAVQQLLANGHKKIAFVGNSQQLYITTERKEGYFKALKKYDIPKADDIIFYCEHGGNDKQENENVAKSIVKKLPEIDAIFIASDRISSTIIPLLNQFSHEQCKIPIVGFSNNYVLSQLQKNFTAIKQPAFEMGAKAAEKLIDMIERMEKNKKVYIDTIELSI